MLVVLAWCLHYICSFSNVFILSFCPLDKHISEKIWMTAMGNYNIFSHITHYSVAALTTSVKQQPSQNRIIFLNSSLSSFHERKWKIAWNYVDTLVHWSVSQLPFSNTFGVLAVSLFIPPTNRLYSSTQSNMKVGLLCPHTFLCFSL